MRKLLILGSACAVPDVDHENTYMALVDDERTILIDCAGSPVQRLQLAEIKLNSVSDLILTHFHPDHVSGVPALLMNMWLTGRVETLNIYGLNYTLDRMERLMEFYSWASWPNFFPVTFVRLPESDMAPVLNFAGVKIFSSPVRHMIPNIGLRFELPGNEKAFAYSCDTEPCTAVEKLAADAEFLIHEATGEGPGHSSAFQAGEIAQKVGVNTLYLIHYPVGDYFTGTLVEEAKKSFKKQIVLAKDFMEIKL